MINFQLIAICLILTAFNVAAQSGLEEGISITPPQMGISVVMGSKERIPVKRLPNSSGERSMITCSSVSTFDPDYEADMPAAAELAFDYALDLLSDIFVSSVDITLDVTWEDVPGNAIGFAGASAWRSNYSFYPESNKWYPEVLTNIYFGSQLFTTADINVTLDSSANWYFGTDGNPAWNQIDLVTVIVHEVSHGMGFAGTAQSNGATSGTSIGWGTGNWPNIYDPMVVNGAGTSILNIPNNSAALVAALISDDLYFDGFYTNGSNGGTPPKIKSDGPWTPGSSYSHLGDEFADEALRSYIVTGDAIHTLDTLGVSMMRDMGWEVCNDNCLSEMTVSSGTALDGTQAYSAAFESDGAIESIQDIDAGVEVHYDSQVSVELLGGFGVDANATFEILINGCGDN